MIYTVGQYLDKLNDLLKLENPQIRGEIGKVEQRERTIYFTLKDSNEDESAILNCLIFRSRYKMMGVEFKEGLEVIISGKPNIYKPLGRLSIVVETVELVGQGALKKAYEELKKKLEKQGLFSEKRKRKIPPYVQKVGLITSRYGDALGDFSANLEKVGFKVKFYDSRVEGQSAVPDLIEAVEWFNKNSDCQVLVIIRGGGSWESLQAFNNEAVARAVANSRIPVLCGIGHERDVPIVSLVADKAVSTPTATAQFLSQPWKELKQHLRHLQVQIFNSFSSSFYNTQLLIEKRSEEINSKFEAICKIFPNLVKYFEHCLRKMDISLKGANTLLLEFNRKIKKGMQSLIQNQEEKILFLSQRLLDKDPKKQLKLGYSLVLKGGKVVKSSAQIEKGDLVKLQFYKGWADSEIKNKK